MYLKSLSIVVMLLITALTASAEPRNWVGTLTVDFGGERLNFPGTGVADITKSLDGYLEDLHLAGGITGSGTVYGTDATVEVKVTLGTGKLGNLNETTFAAPFIEDPTLLIRGNLLYRNSPSVIMLPLSKDRGNEGAGVGGVITVGGKGSLRISLEAAPWTFTASRQFYTITGETWTETQQGTFHSISSFARLKGEEGDFLQLISPMVVTTVGAGSNGPQTLFSTLTLHFVPEPGLLLMLGAGVLGLGISSRNRMKP